MILKKEIWLGRKNLRFFYFRYKDSFYYSMSVIALIVLLALFFIFNIIIPQFQNWLSIRKEVVATQERIRIINGNINFMRNIDKSILERQSDVALSALPIENDFGPILKTISTSAVSSNISLDDFSFTMGDNPPGNQGLSFVAITLIVHGNLNGIQSFIKELEGRLPLSQVSQIDGNSQFASIRIQFYRKEFPKILVKDDDPIQPLPEKKIELLKTLSDWKNKGVELQMPTIPSASSSAPIF